MAQRIVTLCDVHQGRDEDVPGLTWTVSITPPGAKAQAYEVDLCPDDGKGLSDVLDMVAALGRQVDGPRPRKAQAAQGSESLACPQCDRVLSTKQGLATHLTRAHGVKGESRDAVRRRASRAASGSDE